MLFGLLNNQYKRKAISMWHGQLKTNDQMAMRCSVNSKSCRWFLQVFFNILHLAGIDAWVLYKENWIKNVKAEIFILVS